MYPADSCTKGACAIPFSDGLKVLAHGRDRPLIICEGWATGVALNSSTDQRVVCAMTKGNLEAVAVAMRNKNPFRKIIIAPDNDANGKDQVNPGIEAAVEAALATTPKCHVSAAPPVPGTDFDDLYRSEGASAVKAIIESAYEPVAASDKSGAVAQPDEALTEDQWKEIRRLANLSPVEYDRSRKESAKHLSIRTGTLDDIVANLRPKAEDDAQGTPLSLPEIEPWPEPVDGATLIADMKGAIKNHVALNEHQSLAVTLWVLHAHASEAAEHFPRLHVCSPAKRCGKTTLMRTIQPMVPKPVSTESITISALFRVVEMKQPTLLIDEVDSFLNDNEDMRGLLNAGHARGGQSIINVPVGDGWEPRGFRVSVPTVIAGIGRIPDTLEDRSITISLRRRLRDEKIERLRSNRTKHLEDLGRRAARWVADHVTSLNDADPALPESLNDREHDNWRPLIAISDAISDELGRQGRAAAEFISNDVASDDDSAAIMLLADVAAIVKLNNEAEIIILKSKVPTDQDLIKYLALYGKDTTGQDLINDLVKLEDRPWAEWRRGKPLTTTGLARLLKPFRIKPKAEWDAKTSKSVKKYRASEIQEAEVRYVDREAEISTDDLKDKLEIPF